MAPSVLPITVVLLIVSGLLLLGWIGWQALRRPGKDPLIGTLARAIEAVDPHGRVEVHGELWIARALGPAVPDGSRCEVVGREGLTLLVTLDDEDE